MIALRWDDDDRVPDVTPVGADDERFDRRIRSQQSQEAPAMGMKASILH